MKIKLKHKAYKNCSLKWYKYANGRPALVVLCANSSPLLKASVNLREYQIPEGYICIKDWAENKGILKSLIENDVIEPPKEHIPTGYTTVDICKIKYPIIL